jgi:primosomal protein N' (replication factor Y)
VTAAIAQVEPLTPTRALRGPFDYRLGQEMQGSVGVGSLLLVPFGRQELMGVVVGLSERSEVPDAKLLAPHRAMALQVPAELVELARWLAREYCSTPARALSLMLPPGTNTQSARPRVRLMAELTSAGLALLSTPAPGQDGARRSPGALATTAAGAPPLSARQLQLLAGLADGPVVAGHMPGGSAALRRLATRGLVRVEGRELGRRPVHKLVGSRSREPLPLTADQQVALKSLSDALQAPEGRQILLHGVTGSGKTELYLRVAAEALARGRGAIVLVPEIALTPQMVGRFVERLGDTVAVLHSRLSLGERYDEWRRLRAGAARVCVGPRSAVFAPVSDLGLVVVDEEHESSYKHESDPRYDARAVAAERARAAGALLVLGTATPRAETYHTATRVRLAQRVNGGPLPGVSVLDMRGLAPGLHPQTMHALANVRHAHEKAIVLLNRRGWSAFLTCRECGRVWGCPNCDVALVLHRTAAHMSCHHCGHRQAVPERCNCGSASLARHGMGTERLQRDLKAVLGGDGFPIFRLDGDVGFNGVTDGDQRASAISVLQGFERAPAGVLLGTQMVAKGHDFPGVTLGVVLDADATLAFPDFRAEERTFALIAQLAGRVGRGGDGHVLVQTLAPEARAIRYGARHDSDGFLAGEIERRRMLSYPPFSHLIRVTCSAPTGARAGAAASRVAARVRAESSDASTSVLGPAALFRLRGLHRRALLIKTQDRTGTVAGLRDAVSAAASAREHAGVSFSVDVDPH